VVVVATLLLELLLAAATADAAGLSVPDVGTTKLLLVLLVVPKSAAAVSDFCLNSAPVPVSTSPGPAAATGLLLNPIAVPPNPWPNPPAPLPPETPPVRLRISVGMSYTPAKPLTLPPIKLLADPSVSFMRCMCC
jgi:hypothetical protein